MPRPPKRQKGVRVSSDNDNPPGASNKHKSPEATESVKAPKRYHEGGFNSLKTFNGQLYSGMAVGGSHTWNYDPVSPCSSSYSQPCLVRSTTLFPLLGGVERNKTRTGPLED
jgi:hypothetical protein